MPDEMRSNTFVGCGGNECGRSQFLGGCGAVGGSYRPQASFLNVEGI